MIQAVGITKEFPGVKALDNISFDIMPGEVHVLIGENGAGKSTLMKILSGVYTPTSGKIICNEHEYSALTTKASYEGGIDGNMTATVAQDSASMGARAVEMLVDVCENPDNYTASSSPEKTPVDAILVTIDNAGDM